jgi:hypothetical protein
MLESYMLVNEDIIKKKQEEYSIPPAAKIYIK